MRAYLDLCHRVINQGEEKIGRNGKTISYTGMEFRHNMRKGFPILTVRELNLGLAITELRFFLQGFSSKPWLEQRGNKFWSKFANKNSEQYKAHIVNGLPPLAAARLTEDLGPIYGKQWRNFNGVDQLKEVLNTLKIHPQSRRMLVSAWNPSEIQDMALPPCHDSFQFISNGDDLDLIWRQRSCDMAVGLPFDILLYGLLLELVATEVKMTPRWLIGQLGDCHVYEQNLEKFNQMRTRPEKILPELDIIWANGITIFDWAASDVAAVNSWMLHRYNPHPKIFFEVVE